MRTKKDTKTAGNSKTPSKKRTAAEKDRRTNIINAAMVAVFVLGLLIYFINARGWLLPLVPALSADGYKMNAVTFNYFYRDSYDSFQNAYGDMLASQGRLQTGKSLAEQEYSNDMTWADFFYATAEENARRTMVVYLAAQEMGYELSEEDIAAADREIEAIKAAAKTNGYTLVNSFLRDHYGRGATIKSYREYLLLEAVSNGLSGDYYSGASYTDEELDAWFTENYPDAGDEYDYNTVDFRLIYFPFSGYGYNAGAGTYDYSDTSKGVAVAQAQRVAGIYADGEQTEEAFADLAREYSSYRAADGGLYENAVKDDGGVEAQVLAWAFDEGRKSGDVSAVMGTTGEYLVYWIGEDMPARQFLAQKGLRTEDWNAWYGEMAADITIDVNPKLLKSLYLTA